MSAPKNENSRLFVIGGILVNIVSSVAIIQVNKYIYVNYGYPNMSLTCLHFIITFLGLLLCERFGVFKIKKVPIVKMLPMAASFCGFVVLTNYSLQYNTVGTYQCLKALTTPIVVVISIYLYNQKYSTKVKLTVVPILLGILVNSMYDLKFNTFGLVIGLVGAVITSFYQVWVGTKQKDLQLNALQLLFYQAPLSAVMLALFIPFFEPLSGNSGVFYLARPLNEWLVILLSGFLAFLVNLSIYWIIGTTSALTYNMVGYLKFNLIVGFGIFLFNDPIKFQQVLAILMLLIGLIAYSYFRIKETEQEKQMNESAKLDNLEKQPLENSSEQNNNSNNNNNK